MTSGVTNFPGGVDTKATLLEASNRFSTTLTATLGISDVTMTVASTTGAPNAGALTIEDERIFYDGKTATQFQNLLRGQDGSSAASHANGLAVEGRVIARHVNVLQDAIIGLEAALRVAQAEPVVVNGSLEIWQGVRDFTSIASGTYTADCWRYEKVGAMVHDVHRHINVPTPSADTPLLPYSLQVDCTTIDASIAAGDYCIIENRIEGNRFRIIAQRQFTISFLVYSSRTGIHCVAFRNSGNDRSYVAEYIINNANTWERKTVTVSASPSAGTWDYDFNTGIKVSWALACGTTFQTTPNAWQTGNFLGTANQVNACDSTANDFYIAGFQVDLGAAALPFRLQPFAENLDLCHRYVCKTFPYNVAPASNVGFTAGALAYSSVAAGTTTYRFRWQFPVRMRDTPTVTTYNPLAAGSNWRNASLGTTSGAGSVFDATGLSTIVENDGVAGDTAEDYIAIHALAEARL